MHVETAQWGLGCLERHAQGDGDEWLEAALWAGRHLADIENEKGELPQLAPFPHTFRLDPPWLSALGQGEAASLLVRLHAATGEDGFADAALGALEPMRVRTADGGAMDLLDGRPFPEEYPTTPPSFVLNGGIFALWGFLDVALGLGDERARADFDAGVETLAANIHRWDNGWWSLYDLRTKPIRNVASPAYHALHITQLEAMQLVAPKPQLQVARDRFASYLEKRPERAARLRVEDDVPRARPAQHLPRPQAADLARQGMSLVLCYHAVSPTWPAALSVEPGALREPARRAAAPRLRARDLLRRRRRAPGPKKAAITFDDSYASVHALARPILESRGAVATVFVPTAYVTPGTPMSWPGIDNWVGTESTRTSCCR